MVIALGQSHIPTQNMHMAPRHHFYIPSKVTPRINTISSKFSSHLRYLESAILFHTRSRTHITDTKEKSYLKLLNSLLDQHSPTVVENDVSIRQGRMKSVGLTLCPLFGGWTRIRISWLTALSLRSLCYEKEPKRPRHQSEFRGSQGWQTHITRMT